jgi:Arylsulfotransferase (ASST)
VSADLWRRAVLCGTVLIVACQNEPAAPLREPPAINATSVMKNPDNALSAVVSVRVRNADSVAIRFHLASNPSPSDSVTPAVPVSDDSAAVPVLGLLPAAAYTLRAVAYSSGDSVLGDSLLLTTDTLPSDLPRYTAGGTDPSPGYVVFAAPGYGVVIDNSGRIVWYHHFPNGPGLSFMAEPNGRYVARPPTPDPSDIEAWVEIDVMGNITRTLGCAHGLQPRPHDLIAQLDGSYWLLCDEVRTMDLTTMGGVAQARVTGTAVEHVAGDGTLLFHWSPFDHFAITDGQLADRTGTNVNWTHGNALDLDVDGNLIVSFRNLGEITKIDVVSGAVIWRMGGRQNQFTFFDPSIPMFSGQHSARISAPGELMILDNLGTAGESRAERYTMDEAAHIVRLARSYSSSPTVVTQIGGSVQSLPSGRTLVSFGTAGRVEEYDAAGRLMWSIRGNAGYVFRAERIKSLYAPGVGTAR